MTGTERGEWQLFWFLELQLWAVSHLVLRPQDMTQSVLVSHLFAVRSVISLLTFSQINEEAYILPVLLGAQVNCSFNVLSFSNLFSLEISIPLLYFPQSFICLFKKKIQSCCTSVLLLRPWPFSFINCKHTQNLVNQTHFKLCKPLQHFIIRT